MLADFQISIFRCWSTLTDINEGPDSPNCWNSVVKGCSNIKNFILEQVLGIKMLFSVKKGFKIYMGHYGPCQYDNITPEPVWNRVNDILWKGRKNQQNIFHI